MNTPAEKTREELAAYAHDAWAGWMKYMFGRCIEDSNHGTLIIPKDLVERWKRQMNTSYAELPESEKGSDRDEADKMLKICSVNKQWAQQLRSINDNPENELFAEIDQKLVEDIAQWLDALFEDD